MPAVDITMYITYITFVKLVTVTPSEPEVTVSITAEIDVVIVNSSTFTNIPNVLIVIVGSRFENN